MTKDKYIASDVVLRLETILETMIPVMLALKLLLDAPKCLAVTGLFLGLMSAYMNRAPDG